MEVSPLTSVVAIFTAVAAVMTAVSMLFERGRAFSLAYPGRFVCLFTAILVFILVLVAMLLGSLKAPRSSQVSAPSQVQAPSLPLPGASSGSDGRSTSGFANFVRPQDARLRGKRFREERFDLAIQGKVLP